MSDPEPVPEDLAAEIVRRLKTEVDRRVGEISETHEALLAQYRSLAQWVLTLSSEWPTASSAFLKALASVILEGLVPRLRRAFREAERELLGLGQRPPGGPDG